MDDDFSIARWDPKQWPRGAYTFDDDQDEIYVLPDKREVNKQEAIRLYPTAIWYETTVFSSSVKRFVIAYIPSPPPPAAPLP